MAGTRFMGGVQNFKTELRGKAFELLNIHKDAFNYKSRRGYFQCFISANGFKTNSRSFIRGCGIFNFGVSKVSFP